GCRSRRRRHESNIRATTDIRKSRRQICGQRDDGRQGRVGRGRTSQGEKGGADLRAGREGEPGAAEACSRGWSTTVGALGGNRALTSPPRLRRPPIFPSRTGYANDGGIVVRRDVEPSDSCGRAARRRDGGILSVRPSPDAAVPGGAAGQRPCRRQPWGGRGGLGGRPNVGVAGQPDGGGGKANKDH